MCVCYMRGGAVIQSGVVSWIRDVGLGAGKGAGAYTKASGG